MEDLFNAGGLGAVLRELRSMWHLESRNVVGQSLAERLEGEKPYVDRSVVRPVEEPISAVGGLVALFGSLAPGGAILKRSAADARLFEHEGRAVVFGSLEELSARIDQPDLDVTADDVLVLQNAGPKSGSGMPEAGYLPIPGKLARAGVKDMIRISDARMSGTAFGTIVLHVTPEAATGSASASPNGGSISWSPRTTSPAGRQRLPAQADHRAAISGSTTTTSCRRTGAAISIFFRPDSPWR
jgi:dihydroxy-acid dehydratase